MVLRFAGVAQSTELLKSVEEALQRAVGAGARVRVLGFVASGKITAQAATGTALLAAARVESMGAASNAVLVGLQNNASSLQEDLRDHGDLGTGESGPDSD